MKSVEDMIGSPLLEISRVISGWLNSNTHVVALLSFRCWKICCASPMLCTGVLSISMSQAPQRCVRQRGNLSPGVCGDIVARMSLCWAFSRSRVSDQYGMPTNDDRVLAIGDGKVLIRLPLVMYVSNSGFVSKGTRFL